MEWVEIYHHIVKKYSRQEVIDVQAKIFVKIFDNIGRILAHLTSFSRLTHHVRTEEEISVWSGFAKVHGQEADHETERQPQGQSVRRSGSYYRVLYVCALFTPPFVGSAVASLCGPPVDVCIYMYTCNIFLHSI